MRDWAVKAFKMPWHEFVKIARVCAMVVIVIAILIWLFEKLCRWSIGR